MAKRKNAKVIKKNTKAKQNNPEKNLTGKGKKAFHKLNVIDLDIKAINKQLNITHTAFLKVIGREVLGSQKKRSMINTAPTRIEFRHNELNYYIDFTVTTLENNGSLDVKGNIIYGATRALCFSDCAYIMNNKKCKDCERIARCDRLEDKPIIQLLINQHGVIKSSGELDDEWFLEEGGRNKVNNEKTLLDMHYRALEIICKPALEWTNENILP